MAAAAPMSGFDIIALIMTLVVLPGLLFVYFIPMFIALKKRHIHRTPILLINIFLGWTFFGWVGALVWSTINVDSNQNEKV